MFSARVIAVFAGALLQLSLAAAAEVPIREAAVGARSGAGVLGCTNLELQGSTKRMLSGTCIKPNGQEGGKTTLDLGYCLENVDGMLEGKNE
ncbi:hypothetical protein MY1884_009301 [Beauveria asiatica]